MRGPVGGFRGTPPCTAGKLLTRDRSAAATFFTVIDGSALIAVDPGPPATLVIVEVRWRASRGFGLPEETVDHRKRRHVRMATYGLRDRGVLPDGSPVPRLPVRFDLIVVEPEMGGGEPTIRHHRAAF